jgi:hypothetical protein
MNTTTQNRPQIEHSQIAHRAKEIWEREGRQAGRDLEYWLRAERELDSGKNGASEPQSNRATTRTAQSSGSSKAGKGHNSANKGVRM